MAALPADAALGARRETLCSSALGHLKTVWVHFSRLPKAIIAWVKGLLEDNTLKKQEKVLNACSMDLLNAAALNACSMDLLNAAALNACSMDLLSAAALNALNPMSWRTQYLAVFEGKNELARLINGLRATKEHADSAALEHDVSAALKHAVSAALEHYVSAALQHDVSAALEHAVSAALEHAVSAASGHAVSAALEHAVSAALEHDVSAALEHAVSAASEHAVSAALEHDVSAALEYAVSAALRNEAERLLECVFSRSIQDMLHQCHRVTEAEVAQSKLADLDYWRDLAISVQKVPIEVLRLRKQMLLFSMSFGRGAVDMTPSNVDGLPALCAFA
ncbi:hypothetical protein NPS46_16030 [Pseudomonas putida]|uniref:hypothetical protein n=1 Tax=Pseudomonas putida TaxID=303 RepID=UPI002363D12C|nr:hypothetical protein [Pseudomonas putida]MDD2054060.1 hypothetical protein [Pseudomonas putida]